MSDQVETTTTTETKEKKKASWIKANQLATVTMTDGEQYTFDFSKLSNEVFSYYGKKQWLSDNVANVEKDEKLAAMIANYKEAVEKGVQISDTGKISIIGKERANAGAPKTMDAKILPLLSTFSPDEISSLKLSVKLGLVKISTELAAKLETM